MSIEALETADRAIAIVGLGALLPDAHDVPTFWHNVTTARYSVTEVPPERWNADDYYDPDPRAVGKTYSKIGGWVTGFAFDSLKYRIPPRAAAAMDEAQMWGVVATREALLDAGHPDRTLDLARTAIVLGNAMGGELHYLTVAGVTTPPSVLHAFEASPTFAKLDAAAREGLKREVVEHLRASLPSITEDSMPGELANVVAGRIAHVFDLHGPNYIVDAACASSVAALDAAVEGLVSRHFDVAISGGIDRNMGPGTFVKFSKIGALSPDGSRPFDKRANGFIMGEGAAIFLLKRLADAERAGDKIYAVIRGLGGSSDGKGKGITAPNPDGQKLAVLRAYQRAGISPATVGLIEAHGTSTPVGDIAEVAALHEVLRSHNLPKHSIALGSVKSQIGHLKAASGAAGMLKAVLALHHKVLPPSANFVEANPEIPFDSGPFYVNTRSAPWERPPSGIRRAGVSSFGFGGTNLHLVLEEHVPGMLTSRRPQVQVPGAIGSIPGAGSGLRLGSGSEPKLLRGMVLIAGNNLEEIRTKLVAIAQDAERGLLPPMELPMADAMRAPERIAIDYENAEELNVRIAKALDTIQDDRPAAWKLLRGQSVFRGREAPGKVAFLFPGQGSQYVNMLRELRDGSATVREVFDEADAVMRDRLNGRLLTDLIFVKDPTPEQLDQAEEALRHTTVTQPAMLAADIALARLLGDYGIEPDLVMGHSLGEYAALVAAGAMPFADALVAVSARAREMANVSLADAGKMASVIGPYERMEAILKKVKHYVVAANLNSKMQTVIAGSTQGIDEVSELLRDGGLRVIPLPVSHAFHSEIVAPATEPLRKVISNLRIYPPQTPVVGNVDGELYPQGPDARAAIIDRLGRQIAAPVQFVKGLATLYREGARVFIEVGPKKVLASFAEEELGDRGDVVALATNNPKKGPQASFGAALAYLYSIGRGRSCEATATMASVATNSSDPARRPPMTNSQNPSSVSSTMSASPNRGSEPEHTGALPLRDATYVQLGQLFAEFLDKGMHLYKGAGEPSALAATASSHGASSLGPMTTSVRRGSVVISGVGIGLPGATKNLFGDDNFDRILRGDQFIEPIPMEHRHGMVDKNVVMLVKRKDASPSLDRISDVDQVLKLAGRRGRFDLKEEFGLEPERTDAYDITTAMAVAAGIEALRDARIPLVRRYRRTSKGTYLHDRWMLPEPLADETGVIFASAFPGYDRFAELTRKYFEHRHALSHLQELEELRATLPKGAAPSPVDKLIEKQRARIDAMNYAFERKFLFEVLAFGHAQFAELIGARGPNTAVNSACASTTLALGMAEDWIRRGRCTRVVIVSSDDVTGDELLPWIGAGFLATGAASTEQDVTKAALPFDRRRDGMILGMGASALVVESEDAVRYRGMRASAEILGAEFVNSAFHGTRLDVEHIRTVMRRFIETMEREHGLDRREIAPKTVFISHETYTPARGGSAAAEVMGLREAFGDEASKIVIANVKGFTGHPMGVGLEDSMAVKILERQIVPPIPNFREVDPELGELNLSKGGRYPVEYALRFAAGFGSQLALALMRRVAGENERVADAARYAQWLSEMSGYDRPETEVVHRTLRIKDAGVAPSRPKPTGWKSGDIPMATVHSVQAARSAVASSQGTVAEVRREEPRPVAATVPVAHGAASSGASDQVVAQILKIFADKTGYPTDMLALDLDLEADLGIDTVKQAEVFAELRKTFDLPKRDDLKLRDYPTLQHVISYVRAGRPDLARPPASASAGAVPTATAASAGQAEDPVSRKVLEIVANRTGYPTDMLALDLDLEADLGIDTVKQAEVFAELRAAFELPKRDDLKVRDYPTLDRVISYVRSGRPDLVPATASAPSAPGPTAPATVTPDGAKPQAATPAAQVVDDEITRVVVGIVADRTGYPPDMLALDLDLEADLGVDTVKQAEVFAVVRERFNIAKITDLKLRDYPTLGHVVSFVRERSEQSSAGSKPAAKADLAQSTTPHTVSARRLVPVAMVRPRLELCKTTQCQIGTKSRIVVVADQGKVGAALTAMLEEKGAQVLLTDATQVGDALVKQMKKWSGSTPVTGVFFLRALDREPRFDEMSQDTFATTMDRGVRTLYAVAKALYDDFDKSGAFLVAATRMGGTFGYGSKPPEAPCGGAIGGFVKTVARERPECLVKVLDVETTADATTVAQRLVAEVERDPAVTEVGYADGRRYGITLLEGALLSDEPATGLVLGPKSVVVVTGAGGAITSAIVTHLAEHSKAIFHLLDLAPPPDPNNADLARLQTDREGLKKELTARLAEASGKRVTPVIVERELGRIERDAATLSAVRAIERVGAGVTYHCCDVTDPAAVDRVINGIVKKQGGVDLLVHAAGLERSRPLDTKDSKEFDLVFDVKAAGFYNLLRALRGARLGALVSFSSVAGRFGNPGQVDYAAANDLLCKVTSALRGWRPDTQAVVVDWTAWGTIGMATRGSIPELLKRAGIEMLDPVDGVPVVRRELGHGTRGEVVIAGQLGTLTQPRDPEGGIDPTAATAAPKSPIAMRIVRADPLEGVVIEAVLDPAEPYLDHHRIDGTPVLPGVMGLELFALGARILVPNMVPVAVKDVRFDAPLKCYRDEKRTVQVTMRLVESQGQLHAQCVLTSVQQVKGAAKPAEPKRHFSATIVLAEQPRSPQRGQVRARDPKAGTIGREDVYRAYFHGASFRVVERTEVATDRKALVGTLAQPLPSMFRKHGTKALTAPRLLELCFQTAGLMEIGSTKKLGLPSSIDEVLIHAGADDSAVRFAEVGVARENGSLRFEGLVRDAEGKVLMEVKGYRTSALPSTMPEDVWTPLDAGTSGIRS